jgi:hypothetical protein
MMKLRAKVLEDAAQAALPSEVAELKSQKPTLEVLQ